VEGRPLEEAELIEQAKRGDTEAYAEIVRRYQQLAFRTAFAVTGQAEDAEDAAQEAFVKAYRALPHFTSGLPLRPWLLRIVANEARNRRRSAGRASGLVVRVSQDRPSVDAAPSAEAALLGSETRTSLLDAIGQLRDDDRRVIACRYFLDLSEAETAEVLDLPRGTVKSRLSRALARLRLALATTDPPTTESSDDR
jgi:RNA polymerase sigma-70 factor (ECF subfamily)